MLLAALRSLKAARIHLARAAQPSVVACQFTVGGTVGCHFSAGVAMACHFSDGDNHEIPFACHFSLGGIVDGHFSDGDSSFLLSSFAEDFDTFLCLRVNSFSFVTKHSMDMQFSLLSSNPFFASLFALWQCGWSLFSW